MAELVRALRSLDGLDTRVQAFGGARDEPGTSSYGDLAELAGANPALATLGVDLRDRRCLRRDRPGPLPHLVRQHGRTPGEPPARCPPCRDRPLLGAAASLEGRAAGRRLRRLVVGRAHRLRGRRGGHRGVGRHARRRAAVLPLDRPDAGPRGPQRHRHHRLGADPRPRPGARAGRRPGPSLGRLRRSDHPPEGAAALPARGRAGAAGRPDRAVRRGSRHPRDRGRGGGPGRGPRRHPVRRRVDPRHAAAPRRRRAADRRDRLRLSVDLRAAGDRQPRGDGVRDRRRRDRHRRHPGGRRAGRDRAARADRAGHRRHGHPARPRPLRRRLRRRPQRAGRRPGACGVVRPGGQDARDRAPSPGARSPSAPARSTSRRSAPDRRAAGPAGSRRARRGTGSRRRPRARRPGSAR